MAQRTGAERFLASVTKVASAGGILLALALAGCGGDSGATTSASATGLSAAETASTTSKAPPVKADSSSKNPSSGAAPQPTAHSGKHGPHVAVPKGEPEPAPTQRQRKETVANIALSSPALQATGSSVGVLPATYTCDGTDSWPPLRWQGVPSGTAELALFAMNVQPVREQIFFDWAVAGLDPLSGGIEAATLPKGAVLGQNSFGHTDYSICPPKGRGETYMFALYALPKALGPKKGFDPLALREAALQASESAGLMATSYARG